MPTNNLSWSPAGGAVTSQKIKRGADPSPTTVLATVGAAANTYADTTAQEKNDYYYVVESICANGDALSNEVTICNDGDVSAPVSLGGITYDDSNAPYSGFIVDHYLGNVYGGNSGLSQVAHHLIGHNPGIASWPSQLVFSSNYNSNTNPYGYCDGIFGAYTVNEALLPGFYNNSVFFYIGLNIERSADNGVTKELIGVVDPETQSYYNNAVDVDLGTLEAQHIFNSKPVINIESSTVDFRPTGTDSIYYTLSVSTPSNIAPLSLSLEHQSSGSNAPFLTGSRYRVKYGVIVNNNDVHIGGSESLTTSTSVITSDTVLNTTAEIKNQAYNATYDAYVDVEAFEPFSGGNADTTKVIVRYKVNGGSLQTLGTVYSPAYTGVQSSNNSQRFTLSRTNYQKVEFDILVTGATDTESASNSGGGA